MPPLGPSRRGRRLFTENDRRRFKCGVARPDTANCCPMPWKPPPPSFHAFLTRVLSELPQLRPVVTEQIDLADGEIYSTSILDALSSEVMECQHRLMEGTATPRDAETVRGWLALGEEALSDPYVSDVFLQTAGDDLLFDSRGRALYDRLGPRLRAAIDMRPGEMEWRRRRS